VLIPVMLCFFAMGFVDLVGIASNYVKADLGLTDSEANLFPLAGVLLVPHLQCAHGHADEPHRPQAHRVAQPGGDLRVAAATPSSATPFT